MFIRYRMFRLCGLGAVSALVLALHYPHTATTFTTAASGLQRRYARHARRMRRNHYARYYTAMLVWLCLIALLALVGCSNPLQPLQASIAYTPLHNNVTATLPTGVVVWLCATLPRQYVLPNGVSQWEEEHYIQYTPCPTTLLP